MTAPNMTPNTVPEWIAAVCASALDRPVLSHPWEFDWSGERWTIGTNGHIAALVRGQFGAPDANAPNSGAPNFLAILGVPPEPTRRTVDLDALRAWLGVDAVNPTCRACQGVGTWECRTCGGSGEVECCCGCGDEHERECDDCDGTGIQKCRTCFPSSQRLDPGFVYGQAFNRRVVRQAVQSLPFARATWARSSDVSRVARIEGDGWLVLIMPVRDDDPRVTASALHFDEVAS